ncbi:MAG: SPOR domain-containing protein [Candidatus Sulfotelmatobacter sp.]
MPSSQDTEITLGTGKLLFLFFSLVAICAVFFALGYSLGRKSEPAVTTASAAIGPQSPANANKAASPSTPPMTFYKAVEQKDATPELTPPADTKTDTAAPAQAPAAPAPTSTASPADPSTTLPTAGYYVQVAAVSKQEDADALVDALKKKEYSAFVASTTTPDKLFHVQVGPFSDIKDAEAMRTKLISDGYSPIVKK